MIEPDFLLASLHHLLVFLLAGILAAEWALVRPGLGGERLANLARIDGAYGLVSMLVIAVGIGRVIFGLKGWEYYVYYWVFWAKMAAFTAVGLLSIRPTRLYIAWRRAGHEEIAAEEIELARTAINRQAAILAVIPVLAAMMARGIGY